MRWRVGAYARDVHAIRLAEDLPPGDYRVEVGLYDPTTGKRPIVDGQGTDFLTLPPLRVLAPGGR